MTVEAVIPQAFPQTQYSYVDTLIIEDANNGSYWFEFTTPNKNIEKQVFWAEVCDGQVGDIITIRVVSNLEITDDLMPLEYGLNMMQQTSNAYQMFPGLNYLNSANLGFIGVSLQQGFGSQNNIGFVFVHASGNFPIQTYYAQISNFDTTYSYFFNGDYNFFAIRVNEDLIISNNPPSRDDPHPDPRYLKLYYTEEVEQIMNSACFVKNNAKLFLGTLDDADPEIIEMRSSYRAQDFFVGIDDYVAISLVYNDSLVIFSTDDIGQLTVPMHHSDLVLYLISVSGFAGFLLSCLILLLVWCICKRISHVGYNSIQYKN
eukprot:Phypoly_transcript_10069.p1 GENE.Phypoly_transcript_10069~~Phypoly_transcript_10069.p1  ORF type:complete len:317 (+),score=27.49 Phypoly_transcript_10069:272-1222(+)